MATEGQQTAAHMWTLPQQPEPAGSSKEIRPQSQAPEACLMHTASRSDLESTSGVLTGDDALENNQPSLQLDAQPAHVGASYSNAEAPVDANGPGFDDNNHQQDRRVEEHPAHVAMSYLNNSEVITATFNDSDAPVSADGAAGDALSVPWIGDQNAGEQDLVPDELDSDSALGSDTESDTTSLAESVFSYRMEHGRTYHGYKDGKYIFPNDEREAERLDLQHQILRLTYKNKLCFAPLTKARRCLDVGTGTGIWAMDFADENPECQVTGIDLSPTQPSLVPPNLKFLVEDAEDVWMYDKKFDFIHLRLMSGSIANWPSFLQQAYDNLEPGGWIELQDYGLPVRSFDGTHVGTHVSRWGELLCEASMMLGRPLGSDAVENYEGWLSEAGFVDIRQKMFMWPTNGWPKDPFMKMLGRFNQCNILDGLEGFCLALLTRGLGWTKDEVDVLVAKVSNDLKDRTIHAYFPMPVTYARKPFLGEVKHGGVW